jgi:hypothetical protein
VDQSVYDGSINEPIDGHGDWNSKKVLTDNGPTYRKQPDWRLSMDDQGHRKSTKESGCPYVVNPIAKIESISRIGLMYIVTENKNVSLIPLILV